MRGAALSQYREDVGDAFKGGEGPKIFKAPSVSPFEKEVGHGSGVHDFEEDPIGFFLGFFGGFRQNRGELFEDRVVEGSVEFRGEGVAFRAKEVISMKGALDLLQQVGGDEQQIVVPEAIESAEEARGDWGVFPAWGGKGDRPRGGDAA